MYSRAKSPCGSAPTRARAVPGDGPVEVPAAVEHDWWNAEERMSIHKAPVTGAGGFAVP
jgi:hypothetical protein